MKEIATAVLSQYVVPVLLAALWFALATIIATVLGHKTQIENWCLARPKLALLIQLCRRTGIDVWGILGALRQYAAHQALANGETVATPPKKSTAIKTTLTSLAAVILISGCAGTFEEARASRLSSNKAKAVTLVLSERCRTLSDRARWEGALAKAGAALTGASGLSTIPFDGKGERIALAGATVVLAGGTVLVTFLAESDASAFVKECAQ